MGGPAGAGIKISGLILSKTFSRLGLNVFGYTEYPSLARGGHNTFAINASPTAKSVKKEIDILIALDKKTMEYHKNELKETGLVIYDSDTIELETPSANYIGVPFDSIAKECGTVLAKNTVALGATIALIRIPFENLSAAITSEFSHKEKVIQVNIDAAQKGFDFIKDKAIQLDQLEYPSNPTKKMLMTGNDAIAVGAIQAGCKFYSAYPMTPASNILHYLANKARDFDIIVKQTEDEIASINVAIGSSFAGVRSMTATSGGGFCLMTEGLGLAAVTETPLVIVNGMRPGPSTGVPTWTEQSDLDFVRHASHGEFPRVVIAPGDIEESFYETVNAFNIADIYQLPVIILTDKLVCESHLTSKDFDLSKTSINRGLLESDLSNYDTAHIGKRHLFTETGVSPRWNPGTKGGMFTTAGNEHDEFGQVDDTTDNRIKMMDKRFKKLKSLENIIPLPQIYGDSDAVISLVCWGSGKLSCLDALELLEKEGISANIIHFKYLIPFPNKEKTINLLNNQKQLLLIENNFTAQLGSLIKENLLLDIPNKLLKYDGRPFYPSEIVKKVKELTKINPKSLDNFQDPKNSEEEHTK